MILIKSKFFCIRPPDRCGIAPGTSRTMVITAILLVEVVGLLVSGDTVSDSFLRFKDRQTKPGNIHRTERYVRDTNDKSEESDKAKQPYQSFREPSPRFADSRSNFAEMEGFSGKGSEKVKSSPLTSRIVRTKYGDVSGVIITPDSRHLEPVEVFRGIPYAMPPTGSLRFMPPVTSALWSGVKIADKFSPVCPQRLPDISNETLALKKMPRGRLEYLKRLFPYLQTQSEDCLYLNIYAPAQAGARESSGSSKYPVMVFVHGESYEWNSGNPYDGSVLASYGGVVVVTINYRLGILGFLNVNTDANLRSPANYGLMDQIAALHWIQENIGVFGGDPTNVTILGHGTGAACVNLLMTSSAVPDGLLFHRAILMSGSALSPWALVQTPTHYAHQVARHANCSPDLPHPHLLKCLRDRPLESLLSTPIEAPDFAPVFGPSIDGVVIDSDELADDSGSNLRYGESTNYHELLSNQPKPNVQTAESVAGGINTHNSVLLRKSVVSRLSRYDLLLGVVRAESYFAFNGEDVQYGIEGDRRSKILRTFVKENYRYHLSEILATIINEYTDWERPVQHPINIRDETLEALSDAMYVAPVVHTADLHSAARRNSYLYVFDYQTKNGDFPQRQGCIHGEELPYIFGAPLVGGLSHFTRNYTKSEMSLAEATMIYWSNFARTGNPNEPQEPDMVHGVRQERNRFKNIEWTAYEGVHKKYLNLDTKPKVKNHFRAHRLSFWLNLVPDLHRPGGDDVPRTHHLLSDGDGQDNLVHTHDLSKVRAGIQQPKKATETGTVIEVTGKQGTVTGKINLNQQFDPNMTDNRLFTVRGLHPLESIITDNAAASASASATPPQQEDGFAAYSTALSVTIAIGCSLLIVNVLIFAGVYYQRDKNRLSRHHHHDTGSGSTGSNNSIREVTKNKKIMENGIPNSICGDMLLNTEVCKSNDPGGTFGHIHHHIHHQLPPPEFADLPNNTNLPRPPPPPKQPKGIPCPGPKVQDQNFGTLPRSNLHGPVQYATGTLPRSATSQSNPEPAQTLHVMNPTGTLTKKNTILNSKTHQLEELRV